MSAEKIIGVTVGTPLNPEMFGGGGGNGGGSSIGSGILRTELVIDTPVWETQPTTTEKHLSTITLNKFSRDWDNSADSSGPEELIVYQNAKQGDMTYWVGGVELNTASLIAYQPISSITDGILTTASGGVYNYTGTAEFVNASAAPTEVNLKSLFKDYTVKNYFVTLKATSGITLPSGQFKLTETIDGYATAIDCVFTIAGHKLTENYPVDFKEVDGKLMMRDAGVIEIIMDLINPLSRKLQILYNGKTITTTTSGAKYIYYSDEFMKADPEKIVSRCRVGKYNGYSGILNFVNTHLNNGKKITSFRINAERTKNGMVGQWDFLTDVNNSHSNDPWFTDTTAATDDFTKETISYSRISSNKQIYYANGSSVILEETA